MKRNLKSLLRLESQRVKQETDPETRSELSKGKFSGGREGGYLYHFETEIDQQKLNVVLEVRDATSIAVYKENPSLLRNKGGLDLADMAQINLEYATRMGRKFVVQDMQFPEGGIRPEDLRSVVDDFIICFFALNSSFYNNAPEPLNVEEKFYPDTLEFGLGKDICVDLGIFF